MKLRLKSGKEFHVSVMAHSPGRTAVSVRSAETLTKAECAEADQLINQELFGGNAEPAGLILEPDRNRARVTALAFCAKAMERN